MIFIHANVDLVYDVSSENTEKHTTNTGLLARPHSIRKTRLNVFIRSNVVRGGLQPFRKRTNNFGSPRRVILRSIFTDDPTYQSGSLRDR